MPRIHVAAAREIGAPPETIYRLLADYRAGHPRILPPEHFLALEVEEGGVGAGTVARTVVRAGGRTQRFHLRVSEPEPGRVLQEQDTEFSLVTRFTVTPVRGGRASRVEIATDLEPPRACAGRSKPADAARPAGRVPQTTAPPQRDRRARAAVLSRAGREPGPPSPVRVRPRRAPPRRRPGRCRPARPRAGPCGIRTGPGARRGRAGA